MGFDGQECLGYKFEKKILSDVPNQIPLNEKELRTWLTTLPMLNVEDASKQLQQYLVTLNQINIADKQRLSLLEALRPTVANLIDIFIRSYSGRVPGLTQEGQTIYELVSGLNKNMAEGYTFLLNEIAGSRPNILTRKRHVLLVERSLFYLAELLHLTFLMYMPKPANTWRLIHNTYRYAMQLELHQVLVTDTAVSENDKVTADFLYKRIILQSMISPDSLRSVQIDAIYRGLSPWLDEILVVSPDTTEAANKVFHINYLSDNGPTSQEVEPAEGSNSLWFVDNNRLIERIWLWEETGEIEKLEDGPVNLSNDLLMYLVNILGVRPKFERDRVELYGDVSVVTGLSNIETVLGGVVTNRGELSGDLVSDASQNWGAKQNDDVWNLAQYVTPEEKAHKVVASKEQNEIEEELTHHWQFVNRSAQGLGLLCQLSMDNLLGIGQLLAFKYEPKDASMAGDKTPRWFLGTVCWMRAAQTIGGVYAGIRILGGNVQTAGLQQPNNTKKGSGVVLLLDSQQTELKTVLVSRNHAGSGDKINIKYHNKTYNIQLQEIVWQNDGFTQFQYVSA